MTAPRSGESKLQKAVWAPSDCSSQLNLPTLGALRQSLRIQHLGIRRLGHNDPPRSPSLSSKCPCWNGRPGFPTEPARFIFNEHKPHYQTVLASLAPQLTGGSMDNDWLNL